MNLESNMRLIWFSRPWETAMWFRIILIVDFVFCLDLYGARGHKEIALQILLLEGLAALPTWISYINRVCCGKFRVLLCEKERLYLGLVIWYLWVAIWNSERGLLLLGFGFTIWWFTLSLCVATIRFDLWLSFLVCAQFAFGIWYSYLVFVNLWFLGFVFVRESYLSVFEI